MRRTGLPAALLRGIPSAIRDDRFTRCPFPAATTHAPVALARSSNTAMEHRNRCTDLRHPELLATSLLKCPRQDCCETPSETKKIGKLSPLSSFIFLTLRHLRRILKSYADYYNSVRTHRSLHKDAPISRPIHQTGIIRSHPILGGLHHHYIRV